MGTNSNNKNCVGRNDAKRKKRTMQTWAARNGVELRFIQPGTPVQNAYIECFNRRFRDECLSQHWIASLNYPSPGRHGCFLGGGGTAAGERHGPGLAVRRPGPSTRRVCSRFGVTRSSRSARRLGRMHCSGPASTTSGGTICGTGSRLGIVRPGHRRTSCKGSVAGRPDRWSSATPEALQGAANRLDAFGGYETATPDGPTA